VAGAAYWNRERIVAALRAWAQRHGRAPTMQEWQKMPPSSPPGYEHRPRPVAETVKAAFGSWSAGLAAAGLEPRTPGGQVRERCKGGHDEWRTRPDGKRFCAACRREKQRRMREDARKWRRRLARQRAA
jgi:hypothetical protein